MTEIIDVVYVGVVTPETVTGPRIVKRFEVTADMVAKAVTSETAARKVIDGGTLVELTAFRTDTDGAVLSPVPSQKLFNHSPDGFQWGYMGSGPAQLALALLLDATGDKDLAIQLHQAFKEAAVAGWGHHWVISKAQILDWVKSVVLSKMITAAPVIGGENG